MLAESSHMTPAEKNARATAISPRPETSTAAVGAMIASATPGGQPDSDSYAVIANGIPPQCKNMLIAHDLKHASTHISASRWEASTLLSRTWPAPVVLARHFRHGAATRTKASFSGSAPGSLENRNLTEKSQHVLAQLSGTHLKQTKLAKAGWPLQEASSEATAPCFARTSSLQIFSLLKHHVSRRAPMPVGSVGDQNRGIWPARWLGHVLSPRDQRSSCPSVAQHTRLVAYTLKPTQTCMKGSL